MSLLGMVYLDMPPKMGGLSIDLEKIQKLRSQGLSLRAIAKAKSRYGLRIGVVLGIQWTNQSSTHSFCSLTSMKWKVCTPSNPSAAQSTFALTVMLWGLASLKSVTS